jgi:hypothetical protein
MREKKKAEAPAYQEKLREVERATLQRLREEKERKKDASGE